MDKVHHHNKVSIILVASNSQKTIKPLLDSLAGSQYPNLEVVTVNNGSTDKTVEIIERMLPYLNNIMRVKLIKLNKNIGYCKAANIAVRRSSGKFLLFIDHDIVMTPSVIDRLVEVLNQNPNLGAVQPKVVSGWDLTTVDSYDVNESGSIRGIHTFIYRVPRRVLYSVGACFMMRRDLFIRIGGFFNDFFVGYQDVDLGWRLRLLGYDIITVPDVEIYHYRGILRDSKHFKPIFEYTEARNKLVMMLQNLEVINIIRSLPKLMA
ncbi:MAG: hypothetical protein DRO67_02210 [Candidatus Asgardarchaeum californiense]|nr:MAG: hypothetical protein DRO67_02210 [Candidatus Asgardarchaeum californiense]